MILFLKKILTFTYISIPTLEKIVDNLNLCYFYIFQLRSNMKEDINLKINKHFLMYVYNI